MLGWNYSIIVFPWADPGLCVKLEGGRGVGLVGLLGGEMGDDGWMVGWWGLLGGVVVDRIGIGIILRGGG